MTNEIVQQKDLMVAPIGSQTVSDIVEAVKSFPIMKAEDSQFLAENSEHLGKVMEHCFMWRTDFQKRSIIDDRNHPDLHSKFHQSILEQKVQFDQAMYLAKQYEMRKLDVEDMELDIAELDNTVYLIDLNEDQNTNTLSTDIIKRRNDVKRRRLTADMNFAQYELQQMRIQMKYRMKEVRGWQEIENELMETMLNEGHDLEYIWHKESDEVSALFFVSMNNLPAIMKSTDAGEVNNLIQIAIFSYNQAKQYGLLEDCKRKATPEQLESIRYVEELLESVEKEKADK